MEIFQKVALVFTIIGALNWGLIGFFEFNLVEALFSTIVLQRIVYAIVGVCGLINTWILFTHVEDHM